MDIAVSSVNRDGMVSKLTNLTCDSLFSVTATALNDGSGGVTIKLVDSQNKSVLVSGPTLTLSIDKAVVLHQQQQQRQPGQERQQSLQPHLSIPLSSSTAPLKDVVALHDRSPVAWRTRGQLMNQAPVAWRTRGQLTNKARPWTESYPFGSTTTHFNAK
ncbi:hypothetical protein BGZ83_011500 [Gryganskiella cystojenkinii]|nr:hypothetical protein BGZ83_011500 [Gryganskiella cystojenkinii]